MKTSIFIPKTIKVGFQNREGTYTGKLAYVIYYDHKGKLRKEASWQSWRDKKISDVDFENVPTQGFVLNKKVGDYCSGWDHRQAYCRVYDPRNYEFEITIENLLYILENTSSIKGKGLEGSFVYGWSGADLVLIPTDSPDYKEIEQLNNLRHENTKFNGKDLIIGATYKSYNNEELIYLGRFYESNRDDKESKAYFFYNRNNKYSRVECYKSLSNKIIDIVDDKCVNDYADLMDELQKSSYYSEREPKKDKYVTYTLEEFKTGFERAWYYSDHFYTDEGKKYFVGKYYSYRGYNHNDTYELYNSDRNRKNERIMSDVSLDTIFSKYKPMYLVTYKTNGELIKEWKNKNE